MLENFKKVNLTIGLPYMSVTDNGVAFSKSAIIKMGKPEFVALLMNEETKQIAIKICDKSKDGSLQFAKNAKTASVRWNNKDFLNTLSKMMDWNLKEGGYRILGEWFNDEQAMIFDLTKANAIGDKDTESDD